jgi:hypothetical protein
MAKTTNFENIFETKHKDKWFVFTSGPHMEDAKIFNSKEMAKKQQEKLDRHDAKSTSPAINTPPVRNTYMSPVIKLTQPNGMILSFSSNYIGPFDSFFMAKKYILQKKMASIDHQASKLRKDFLNNDEFIATFKRLKGYYKIEKALESHYDKYPEYML